MSEPKKPMPAKLVISILFQGSEAVEAIPQLEEALALLKEQYGDTDYVSRIFPFDRTTYYNREMGEVIQRKFISFSCLIERDQLADIKLFTNSIEKKYLDEHGNRLVNIDPGILSLENFILASGKNFTHRIYLKSGIFAEVTLLYQNKQFVTLPWTYPDYSSEPMISHLVEIRKLLSQSLKKLHS